MKESSKRHELAELIGSEAYAAVFNGLRFDDWNRYCPGKTDQGFVRRQLMQYFSFFLI